MDGDLGYGGLQVDLAGVTVHVFADPSFMMGTTTTDEFGRYTIGGLPPNAQGYKVKFDVDPPHAYTGEYYSEWWNNHPTGATADFIPIAHGGINIAGIYALLQPKPWLSWIHPESAANDGPNRFATEVTMGGWGSDFISSIWLEQQASPNRVIYAYDWWYEVGDMGEETVHALFNLATPLAPTGMYRLGWSHYDPWDNHWSYCDRQRLLGAEQLRAHAAGDADPAAGRAGPGRARRPGPGSGPGRHPDPGPAAGRR